MLIQGNALQIPLKDECVQCVVTSPPYWGLRDYGTARWEGGEVGCSHEPPSIGHPRPDLPNPPAGWAERDATVRTVCQCPCGARRIDFQLGLERTPEEYIANMVAVFREVWRVLRKDGTIWVNIGDSYAASQYGSGGGWAKEPAIDGIKRNDRSLMIPVKLNHGLKSKDLVGIPWRLAFALQADGWWLRSDIIWSKPNPMPESVTDRPTKAHEYLFLMAKSERYFYDADAIKETAIYGRRVDPNMQPRNGRNAQSSGMYRNVGNGKEEVQRGGD